MANRTMDIKLLNVTKTTAEWADVVVAATVISKGLLCIELDTNGKSWAKVGDGVHTYSQLPYITDGAVASLGNLFTIKGVVATYEDLPSSGNHAGDVYFVGDSTQAGSDIFEEYVWTTGSKWEFIGKTGEVVIPAYTGGTGISVVDGVDSKVINHTNSITAGTASGSTTGTLVFGGTFDIPTVTYDAQGHITEKGTTTMTMPANPDTTYTLSGAYGSGNATWVTTLTPSSGSATTSTVPTASTSVYGITTLTDSTSSTSTTTAATPNSVKSAYDLANSKSIVSVSGLSATGTSIGTITVNGTANSVKVPLTSIESSSGTSTIDLAANTTYALSAGGSSVIFKTPAGAVYTFDPNNDYTGTGDYVGATVATVKSAIGALDGGTIGTPGTGKTITALSQTDGNISATFSDISITKSQISDFPANIVNSVTYDTTGANPQIKVASNGGTASAIVSVTDNSSATDVTSSDTNLITARTLYYAGYVHEDDSLTLNCTL